MTQAGFDVIAAAMYSLGLNYDVCEYNVDEGEEVPYPYFVGEYQEIEPLNEDGEQESLFILSGFSRDSWPELEKAKRKIKSYFPTVGGKTVIADGTAVAVFYSNSLVIPTGDAELKKIQINLNVKEWSVN